MYSLLPVGLNPSYLWCACASFASMLSAFVGDRFSVTLVWSDLAPTRMVRPDLPAVMLAFISLMWPVAVSCSGPLPVSEF